MEAINEYYEKVNQFDLTKEQKSRIIDSLKKIETAIFDVITYGKTYEELKDLYGFPAFFDKDNGILYAYQLTLKNNKSAFLLLIWKKGILNMDIMAFDLEAVAASRNYEHLKKQHMQKKHMTENTQSEEKSDVEETKESDNIQS